MHEAEMDQTNPLDNKIKFNTKSRPKTKERKDEKRNTLDIVSVLYVDQGLSLDTFRKGTFPIEETTGKLGPSDLASVAKDFAEWNWKYQLLNKCSKDYQLLLNK